MYEISKQLEPTQYHVSAEGLFVYSYVCMHTHTNTGSQGR